MPVQGALLLALCCLTPGATSENFRVENQVFVGGSDRPTSQSTTIFYDGVVYDYMDEPSEVIVFDKGASRFTLLDTARRVRAEFAAEEVVGFTDRLQQAAAVQDDPFLRFLASPAFDEQFDKESRELTLSSTWMTYRLVLTDAGSRAVAEQYREFADWYARLNALLRPGARPPLARLLVNAAMFKYEAIAREVFLTVTPKESFPPKRLKVRSHHQLVRTLAQSDIERVGQTRQFMTIFKPVGFEEYRVKQ